MGVHRTPYGIQCNNAGQYLLMWNLMLTNLQAAGKILIDHFGYCKHNDGLQRNDNRSKRSGRKIRNQNDTADAESTYVTTLPKEQQEEIKKEMLGKRKADLIFISPLLKGITLRNKLWRKCLPYSSEN